MAKFNNKIAINLIKEKSLNMTEKSLNVSEMLLIFIDFFAANR